MNGSANIVALACGLAIVLSGCAVVPQVGTYRGGETEFGPALLNYERFGYQADAYVGAAAHLQAVDHQAAADLLMFMARSSTPPNDDAVFILCRMLFTNRPTMTFRRPMIGGGAFLGGTDYADWPLEPIENVDGVPFLISTRGLLSGLAESNIDYLQYCLSECDWSTFRFSPISPEQKRAALDKLLSSPKWRRALNECERRFLTEQIR